MDYPERNITEKDLIRSAVLACKSYYSGGPDPTTGTYLFTSATFSNAFNKVTGIKGPIDGLIVQAMLCGRDWVIELPKNYWQLTEAILMEHIL